MTLNLTNHKEKILPNGKTYTHKPHLISQFDKSDKYKGKFDKLFQPAGHNYTASFDTLKLDYVLRYDLITAFDVSVYEWLYLFCKSDIPFSIDVFAKKLKCCKDTLRQSLDNLENAELLEIVKVNDERGQHNCYLLRTPLFSKDYLEFNSKEKPDSNHNRSVKSHRDRIHAAGQTIPTEFLEDNLDRLRSQIQKNNVRRVRQFLRDTTKTSKFKRLASELKQARQMRQFVWKEIFNTLGSNAADFEQFIFSHTKELAKIPTAKGEFKQALTRFVKKFCEQFNLVFNTWFVDKAEKLFEFFRIRLKIPKAKAEENYYSDAPEQSPFAEVDEDFEADKKEQTLHLLRKILTEKTEKARNNNAWTKSLTNDITRFLRDYLSVFTVDELENIAAEFIPNFLIQKMSVELRN